MRIVRLMLVVSGMGAALAGTCAWLCVPDSGAFRYRVSSPEGRLLVVQVDPTPAERLAGARTWKTVGTADFHKVLAACEKVSHCRRGDWETAMRELSNWHVSDHEIRSVGYWKGPVGQSRIPDGTGRLHPVFGADVVYHVFLELEKPLADGEAVTVTTPFGRPLPFTRRDADPTPFIKVNQVGYHPAAAKRYAYLGGWLGSGGAWRPPTPVPTFELVSVADGQVVKSGSCRFRTGSEEQTKDGVPWFGESLFEMDISGGFPEGEYFLRVPQVGRSQTFAISSAGVRTALNVHLHGLLAQRCGFDRKCAPLTEWGDAPCHLKVRRGTFPPDDADYTGNQKNLWGFKDAFGHPVKVSHFSIIRENTDWSGATESFPGGWHDAADYDRRPYHLSVVTDLAGVWLNGAREPDDPVLAEAAWGLEHLRRAQTAEGGVGTWIETVRHPVEGEGMPSQDKLEYVLSRPTRGSTLAYAAAAAELAACTDGLRDRFGESAKRAWRWAHETPSATNVPFAVMRDGVVETVYWSEPDKLLWRDLVKAAVNLFVLTGDDSYLAECRTEAAVRQFDAELRRDGWRLSPLALIEVFVHRNVPVDPIRLCVRRWIVGRANKQLAHQPFQPYRLPRWNGNDLAWGKSHPLQQALALVAAHVATGEGKYLEAAYLAYDYHCGCNPDGLTLTSGLGTVYPVRFLSLQSTADSVDEYVAGITPCRWIYGVKDNDYKLVHAPSEVDAWPIWRRRVVLEALSVGSSEYTVHETIGPAAAVTAYLDGGRGRGAASYVPPKPRGRPEELPGYWALP